MITYRLSRALRTPPNTHPLFQRILHQPITILPWYVWLIALVFLPYAMLMILVLSATAFGIRWLIDINNTLTREYQCKTYTLLAVTPSGEFGIRWIITTGIMYRGGAFQRLHNNGFWLGRLMLVLGGLALFLNPAPNIGQALSQNTIPLEIKLVLVIVILAGFVIHHFQSVALCILIALLVPTYTHESRTAPLVAVGSYIIIQLLSYLLTFMAGFLLLPAIINRFDLPEVQHAILQMTLQLLIFVAICEVIVFTLWQITLQRYHLTPTEINEVLN